MKRYSKVYKVIALWNSYHSLGSYDYNNKEVMGAMDYCLNEIKRLGVDPNKLPVTIPELITHLKSIPKQETK